MPRSGFERAPAIAIARRWSDISANSSIVSTCDLVWSKSFPLRLIVGKGVLGPLEVFIW